jgi:nicotinamidase-related amidase
MHPKGLLVCSGEVMSHPQRMSATDTGILVIDVQQKLIAKIPGADDLVRNIAFLLDSARLLDIPAWGTEQYPQGLGPTIDELARRLPERLAKVRFSCGELPEVLDNLRRAARPKMLLAGIEAHVCVQQTALDLLTHGFQVFVAADATGSRYSVDKDFALRRLERAGAVVTTSESAAFEWLGGSNCPQFKPISRLVQERMKALRSG